MEIDDNPNVGQKGRFYLTKNIWLPQEPIEKLQSQDVGHDPAPHAQAAAWAATMR